MFAAAGIKQLLDEHRSGAADHRRPLFGLLAFDLWCDRTFGEEAAVSIGEPDLHDLANVGGAA